MREEIVSHNKSFALLLVLMRFTIGTYF